jgi:radical SAM superfamily enzyme YgiQ (UPF0313 family)
MIYHGIILTDALSPHRIRPMGAYVIANELRKQGYNILVIDFYYQMGSVALEDLLRKNISDDTIFLGYSSSLFASKRMGIFVPNNDREHFVKTNQLVKTLNPNIKILFGGANSKALSSFNLRYRFNLGVDYAMHGYSESMIVDFVNNEKNNLPQRVRSSYNNLKEIDYDFKAEDFEFNSSVHSWKDEDVILKNEVLPLEVARGCIFKCKFCAYPLLGKNPKDNSYIKREDVLLREILENYEKYNTTNYFIIDDTFNERTDKIQMLLNVRDRSKIDLRFGAFNRIELIARKPEQLPLLKDLNLSSMFFGIESLNYETSKTIGKGIKKEEISETLSRIRTIYNNNISITTGLIIGLPHETEETFSKNFEWITREDSGVDTITISPLELATSTHTESSFIKNPEKYGYTILKDTGKWVSDQWTSDRAGELARKYILEIQQSGRQKVSSYTALVLTGLGYDFEKLIKMSEKDLDYNAINIQQKSFINNYIQRLKLF